MPVKEGRRSRPSVLLVERKPPLTWLTLNRPEVHNCLNIDLLKALKSACEELSSDQEVRVVLITGMGSRTFCAGADLKERKTFTDKQTVTYINLIQEVMCAVADLPQPVIAVINGSCWGGGTELACACDLRVMADDATLALTEVKLGIMPAAGGTQRLPRLIGSSLAKEIILTGAPITAGRATAIGLVHKLVTGDDEDLDNTRERLCKEAETWALEIAKAAPLSLKQAKYAINDGQNLALEEALKLETKYYLKLLSTNDRKEALRAFSENRYPKFTGT